MLMLNKIPFDPQNIPKSSNYCDLIMSQLHFMESFVEDLLDLRQLKEGMFTLVNKAFDVVSVLKNISMIFTP